MTVESEDLEKYINHKNIFDYFNNNTEIKTMKLYTSFVGNITVQGYKSSSQLFTLLDPCEVILERKKEGLLEDTFGEIDELLEESNNKYSIGGLKKKREENDDWSPYPIDAITHFEWNIKVTKDSEELSKNHLAKLKFFPRIEMAEVNFIKMMDYHLDKTGLNKALETYKILSDKLGEKYPDYFFI